MLGNSRGDILLFMVVAMTLIVGILGWMLAGDEIQQLRQLDARTQRAWQALQPCFYQRNAVLDLNARLFLKAEEAADAETVRDVRRQLARMKPLVDADTPSRDLLEADRRMEKSVGEMLRLQIPRLEKLSDLLASSQNRLALQRKHYDKRAQALVHEMHTVQGAVIARMIGVQAPVLLGNPSPAHD